MVISASYTSYTSYTSLYEQYGDYQWPDVKLPEDLSTLSESELEKLSSEFRDPLEDLSLEEQKLLFAAIFDANYEKYIINQNSQVTALDPKLTELKQKMGEMGFSFSFDQERHSFPELNDNAEAKESDEKYFFPASLLNDKALLEIALVDVFKAALGQASKNVKMARPIELPAWQEDCVAEALGKSADIIDTTVVELSASERFRPVDKDISRDVDVKRTSLGTFTIKHVMTGRAPIKDKPKAEVKNDVATFASSSQKKPEITIEVKQPENSAAAFAAASGGGTPGGVKVTINYKGPKIPYNTAHNACGRFSNFLASCAEGGIPTDINALILWVLRESYQEGMNIVVDVRERVKFFNKLKDQIRDGLKALNDIKNKYAKAANDKREEARAKYLADHKGEKDDRELEADFDQDSADAVYNQFDISSEGLKRYVYLDTYTGAPLYFSQEGKDIKNMGELENYIKEMESKLSSVGDDAQVQNINLQSIMQKQAQVVQTLSNLQKLLHDTAMAVVQRLS